MKIGTIGTGFIVKNILESVNKIDGISCEAVCSRSEERGKRLADEFAVSKIYTDLDDMCQDPEIDFIYVASPNTLHYEQAKKALLHGKNVICEKPFTPSVSEAEELIGLAKEKKLFLFEAITTLYHPNYRWIQEHLSEIGQLKMISCTFCQYSSRYEALKAGELPNVFNPEFAGGSLMDINMYNIHFVTGMLGTPDRVEYFAGKHENGVDLHGTVLMQYGDAICQCTGAKDCWCDNGVQILGDQGYISVGPASNNCQSVRMVRKDGEDTVINLEENQWFYEMQELQRIVKEKDYDTCYQNLEKTMNVVGILEMLRDRSKREGGVICTKKSK